MEHTSINYIFSRCSLGLRSMVENGIQDLMFVSGCGDCRWCYANWEWKNTPQFPCQSQRFKPLQIYSSIQSYYIQNSGEVWHVSCCTEATTTRYLKLSQNSLVSQPPLDILDPVSNPVGAESEPIIKPQPQSLERLMGLWTLSAHYLLAWMYCYLDA